MTDLSENFCWYEADQKDDAHRSPVERYRQITAWAGRARGINPTVFDTLITWLQEAGKWNSQELAANKEILMDRIIGRFLRQNHTLRADLTALMPFGVVNESVFDALEHFDQALSGHVDEKIQQESVTRVFQDFSRIQDPDILKYFAGGITGASGTDSIEIFGYVNALETFDASVQWTLFMPEVTQKQQNGFHIRSFEYLMFPALRFIGVEKDFSADPHALQALVHTLDQMADYRCGFDYDMIFLHHHGKGVDAEYCHALWGRFMKAGAPVPEGFTFIDLVPQHEDTPGSPYISQFAFAQFAGDMDSMHRQEGFDCDAMYDVTRNVILGQNVLIPYPDKYWTAEIFLDGFQKNSTAYLFSVEK